MSKWTLVYCLSKELGKTPEAFDTILYCLERSVEFNSRFHSTIIYTDEVTYPLIKHIDSDIRVVNYHDLIFLDDQKIQTLSMLEDNEVLIDPDVFLYKELVLREDCDVILEREEDNWWHHVALDESRPLKYFQLLKESGTKYEICNIGVMKFFNSSLKQAYIDFFYQLRKLALDEIATLPDGGSDGHNYGRVSMLMGQLGIATILDKFNSRVNFIYRDSINDYKHLSGFEKYKPKYIDRTIGTLPKSNKSNSLL